MRNLLRHGAVGLVWLAAGMSAAASDRVALHIANSDYGSGSVSSRAGDDLMKELEGAGFRVERKKDLDAKGIESALRAFFKTTPTGGTAVICFSGYGYTRVSGQHKQRTLGLQGVGEAKDERSAERASFKLDRLRDMVGRDSGAASHYFVLDLPETHPHFQESLSITESRLAEGPEIDGLRWYLGGDLALSAVKNTLRERAHQYAPRTTADSGRKAGERWINGVGMSFSWCPPGKFRMGIEPRNGLEYSDARPVEAELTQGFWIATYELTQREYRAIRGKDPNRGSMRSHRNAPVTAVGNGAADLAKKLTELERKARRLPDGWRYAVPTEAEWEYACRAGTRTRYSSGDDPAQLARYANFADAVLFAEDPSYHYAYRKADDGVGATVALVGSYAPNSWGIHDMHGNVSESCRDDYRPELVGGRDPFPTGEVKEGERVIRGGAWCSTPEYCQSGFRNSIANGNNSERVAFVGVRLILKKGT